MNKISLVDIFTGFPYGVFNLEEGGLFAPLSDITRRDIAECLQKALLLKEDSYSGVHSFLNDTELSLTKEQENLIGQGKILDSDFGSSLRVTNIQNLNPIIKKIQLSFFKKYGVALTCNAYITPSSSMNCFGLHSDFQETFIYQLAGKKNWKFPMKKGKFLFALKKFEEVAEGAEYKNVTLKEGKLIYISHSILHKAILEEETPSIHLTFAMNRLNAYSFVRERFLDFLNINAKELIYEASSVESNSRWEEKWKEAFHADQALKEQENSFFYRILHKMKRGRKYEFTK